MIELRLAELARQARPVRPLGRCVGLLLAVVLAGSCALPWRDYPVSSAVSGRLVRAGAAVSSGRVRLQVRSRDNAALGSHVEKELPADGGFFFDPISLRVAGREYGKGYVLLLYWLGSREEQGEEHREEHGEEGLDAEPRAVTLWRADYKRAQLGGPIELVCRLDRPQREGPPCRFVGDANDQPWLLAAGARDYDELCASCHGPGGAGDGPAAAALSRPLPDLRAIAARRGGVFPLDEMAAWIDGRPIGAASPEAHGPREMPVWGVRLSEQYVPGGFTEARIRNRIDILVEYLDSLQQPSR